MSKKLLDKFFKENTVSSETPTAPALAHFYITMENDPKANEKIQETLNKAVFTYKPEREKSSLAEKNEIESAITCEQIIRFMRRNTDPVNQHILVNKAMEFENVIVPDIIRRLKTSANDGYIETAIRILAKSKINVAEELIGYFDDMRSPYAQSMVMVVLGFKADESHIPWIIEKYNEFKRHYPTESYCDGAYYALCEIENRFYPVGKRKNAT